MLRDYVVNNTLPLSTPLHGTGTDLATGVLLVPISTPGVSFVGSHRTLSCLTLNPAHPAPLANIGSEYALVNCRSASLKHS